MAAPLVGRVYFGAADAVAVRRWRVDWIGHSCCEDWKDRNTCLDSGLAELSCEVWPKTFGLWYRKWGKSDTRQDRVMLGLEIPKMKNLTVGNLKFTVCLLRWPERQSGFNRNGSCQDCQLETSLRSGHLGWEASLRSPSSHIEASHLNCYLLLRRPPSITPLYN